MKTPAQARQERLAAALRENLKRRKARQRTLAKPDAAPQAEGQTSPDPRRKDAAKDS
jgi:hypothetical protein